MNECEKEHIFEMESIKVVILPQEVYGLVQNAKLLLC